MSTPKSPTLQARRNPFSQLLQQLDYGSLEQDATDTLQDLVHACTETGKAGELTIKLKIKPVGNTGQMELDADVTAKVPTHTRGKTLMFATPDNNLQREFPHQQTLDGLRTADEEAAVQARLRVAPQDGSPPKSGLRVAGGNEAGRQAATDQA